MQELENFVKGTPTSLADGLVFGDQSAFARAFRDSVENDHIRGRFSNVVGQMINNGTWQALKALLTVKTFSDVARNETKAKLKGTNQFLKGLCAYIKSNREINNNVTEGLNNAVNAFDQAWPVDRNQHREKWATGTNDLDELANLLGQLNVGSWRGQAIVSDLLRRFCASDKSSSSSVWSATTAVLLCEQRGGYKNGRVVWLTVELIPDGGIGFCPDPMALGLTSIRQTMDNQPCLLDVMDRMWLLSGVEERGFRGRWRIETLCPLPTDHILIAADHQQFRPLHVYGPSIECAALVAILAASGCIDYDDFKHYDEPTGRITFSKDLVQPMYKSLRLHPRVVVSAAVADSNANGTRAVDLELNPVDPQGLQVKVGAARDYKLSDNAQQTLLDTLLVSKQQRTSQQIEKPTNANAANATFTGITIEPVGTVGEALHWMLEVNTWTKEWGRQVQKDWESQWAFAYNEHRQYLDREGKVLVETGWTQNNNGDWIDSRGEIKLSKGDWEARRINTGSLEYMRQPVGGDDSPDESDQGDGNTTELGTDDEVNT